jgi:hypothetical protein
MKLNNRQGITLIELLIAMTLSVVIFVILFESMRLSYKSQESGTKKTEITQKIRIIGDRITWLIRGAYPYSMMDPAKQDEQKLFFLGESDRIGFVTTSVDTYSEGPEDIAGLKWVSIFLDYDGLTIGENVFFLEDVFDDIEGKVYVLDSDAKELEFEYLDIPGDDEPSDWVSEWDSEEKQYLPSAVRVNITFEHNEKEIKMPEMIVRIAATRKESLLK